MNPEINRESFTESTCTQETNKEAESYHSNKLRDFESSSPTGYDEKESLIYVSSITGRSPSKAENSKDNENISTGEYCSTLETNNFSLSKGKFEEESKISDPTSTFDHEYDENEYSLSDDSKQPLTSYPENSKKENHSFQNECKQEIHSIPQTNSHVTIQDGLEIKNILLRDEFIKIEFEFNYKVNAENLDEILKILNIKPIEVAKVEPKMSTQKNMKYIITFFDTDVATFYLKELSISEKGTVKPFFEQNSSNEKLEETCLEIRICTLETQEKIYKLQYKTFEDLFKAAEALQLHGGIFGLYLNEEALNYHSNILTIQFLDSDKLEDVLKFFDENDLFPIDFEKLKIEIRLSEEELMEETRRILQDLDVQSFDPAISIQSDHDFFNQDFLLRNVEFHTIKVTLDPKIKTQSIEAKSFNTKNFAREKKISLSKKTYFIIDDSIYKVICEKLSKLIEFLENANIKYSMELINLINSRKICLEGEENENYMIALQQITQLLQGTEIIIQESLISKCFNFTSRTFFSNLEKEYGSENLQIRLKLNPARICIYFMLEDEDVVSLINDFMISLTYQETLNVDLSIYSLKKLHELLEEFDPHSYVLINSGSKGQALITAKNEILSQISKKLDSNLDLNEKQSDYENCKICYQPLGEDCVKLGACGHKFCKSCIEMFISAYVDSSSLVLKCPENSCHARISLSDINLYCSPYTIKLAIQKNIRGFLIENSKSYRHCPNPECLEIFRYQGDENFDCKYCLKSYCMKDINNPHAVHPGKSCEKYILDFDSGIDDKSVKRMKCCNSIIEKTSGCNHITCFCKKHSCWVCLEYFETAKICYNHMNAAHDGYYS